MGFTENSRESLVPKVPILAAKRAICVENSGSITLLFYPEGILGPEISLIAAPNQRRPGTAFLVIELENSSFGIYGSEKDEKH